MVLNRSETTPYGKKSPTMFSTGLGLWSLQSLHDSLCPGIECTPPNRCPWQMLFWVNTVFGLIRPLPLHDSASHFYSQHQGVTCHPRLWPHILLSAEGSVKMCYQIPVHQSFYWHSHWKCQDHKCKEFAKMHATGQCAHCEKSFSDLSFIIATYNVFLCFWNVQ